MQSTEMTPTESCSSSSPVPSFLLPSTGTSAQTTISGLEKSDYHPRVALSRLPAEITIRLIYFLDSPTTVCFALACRDHYATVLHTIKTPLNILCRSRYILRSRGGVKYWTRVGDYAEMMRMLRSWVPNRYFLCTSSAKYHLRNGKHHCAVCSPEPRRKEEGSFDAGKWNILPWSKLLGGVRRVISTRRGQTVISWVEREAVLL